MKQQKDKDETSMKIVSHWFAIPRIWRQSAFWLLVIVLSIFGWMKLLSN